MESTSTNTKSKFEVEVEGVRGWAVLIVAASHLVGAHIIDPGFMPEGILRYLHGGNAGVMLFFLLSGYVIGLTTHEDSSNQARITYLRKRCVRLVPIYVIVMLPLLWIDSSLSLTGALGNLFFLSNFNTYLGLSIPPISLNTPVWSLNYEMIYYLVFLVWWGKSPSVIAHLLIATGIAVLGWFVKDFPQFLAGWCCGWIFWISGWWLSKQPKHSTPPSDGVILFGLLCLLATFHFASGRLLAGFLNLPQQGNSFIHLATLEMLPACFLMIAHAGQRVIPFQKILFCIVLAIPMGCIGVLALQNRLTENLNWTFACILTPLAILFLFVKGCRATRWIAWLGGIGYAVYLIHYPLLYLVSILPIPSGTLGSFFLRSAIWAVLTIAISIILERHMQPALRTYLNRNYKT
ncbi:MAG: acyltransferase [Verrucomicrobiota bacterium]